MFARLLGLRRILRENRDLKERIVSLEGELRDERERTYRLVLALTDRTLTAAGCYALPKEVTQEKGRETKPNLPESPPMMEAYLEAVRQDGLARGRSQPEVDMMIARMRRGENVIPQIGEEEFTIPN